MEENEISINAFGGTELTKRGLAKYLDKDLLSNFQIICSRIRNLEEDKIRIYWVHDLPYDPECSRIKDENFRNKFHLIAFTSQYQYLQFRNVLGLPYDEKFIILDSCIEPIQSEEKPTDTINLIYTSTPQRGLELLLPAFDYLYERNPNIRLDIFSSFKIYGWEEHDKNFEPLYDIARNHKGITYHEFSGSNSNEEVREQLKKSHIFAYPCVWEETFCRSMIEAMSAECLCVHPNFGALPFTSGGLNIMYPGDKDKNKHVNMFLNHLDLAIKMVESKSESIKQRLAFNKAYVDTLYSTEIVANLWNKILKNLLIQYPTIESRRIPEEMFILKTS